MTQKTLLLFSCKHLGNLLIALPHFKAAFEHSNQVYLLIDEGYRDIVELVFESSDRIFFYPRKRLSSQSPWYHRVVSGIALLKQLRGLKFDQVIDVEGETLSANLTRLTGAKSRIGPYRSKRIGRYTKTISFDYEKQHRFEDYAAVCQGLYKAPPSNLYAEMHTTNELQQQLVQICAAEINFQQPFICIHVGATKPYKLWPISHYIELFKLCAQRKIQLVLIGAGQIDREQIAQIKAVNQVPFIDLCDRLSLKQLVRLFQLSQGYIGNDSGPMHLSAAAGTPTLGLFGPTDDAKWQPMGNHAQVVRGKKSCHPSCSKRKCQADYQCMRSIEPGQVFDQLLQIMAIPNA